MTKKKPSRPSSDLPADYPSTMSGYEKESREAEDKLAIIKREKKKPANSK